MPESGEARAPQAEPPPTEPTVAMPIVDLRAGRTGPPLPVPAPTDAATIGGPVPLTSASLDPQSMLGHYRILDPLGRGGMGIVYKAYHAGLDRMYALKVMQVTPQTPADPIERFLREARAVAKIGKHPNIVQVHDVGQHGAVYYLAMDLVEGESLDRAIGGKPMANRLAAEIALKVAKALVVAHAAGIVHRDLKPSNILLGRDGTPQVSDFGLARDVSASARERLSQEGQVLGTLQYMAPEQASGEQERVGPVSDVYGLGATLYEMLTGRAPFLGENQFDIWSKVVGAEPAPLRLANRNVHPDLETICLKSLEKDPARRYPTAGELAEELERFLNNEPIRSRPVSAVSRVYRRALKNRGVVLPLLVAAIILLCVGTAVLLQASRNREKVQAALAVGRQFREQNQPREARDAFQRVVALDPANEEAKSSFAWADGEVKRIEAEADAARLNAVSEREVAEQALRKSGLVQNVLARWVLLAEAIRRMEGTYYDSQSDLVDRQAAAAPDWARVEEFISETPQDPTSQGVMLALAGWARRLAGHDDEGLAWMQKARAADPDLPYGALMEALISFSDYLARQPLPPVRASTRALTIGEMPEESDDMRAMRGRIDTLLAEAAKAKVWGSGIAQDFRQAIAAIQAIQAGRREEAEKGLTAVLGTAAMQVFRTEVYFARAKVRYTLRRFTEGIDDLQRVTEVRPRQAAVSYYLGEIQYGAGLARLAEGADPSGLFEKAIQAYTEATKGSPDIDIPGHRGNVFVHMGDWKGEHGEDPRRWWRKGIEDFSTVIDLRPKDDYAWSNRGNAWSRLARWFLNHGEEAEAALEKAATDLAQSLALNPNDAVVYDDLGLLHLSEAQAAETAGRDPRVCYDRAYESFQKALRADATLIEAYGGLGLAKVGKAQADAMRGVDPMPGFDEAIGCFSEAIRRDETDIRAHMNRSNAYGLRARAEAASGKDPLATFDLALADLDAAAKLNPTLVGLHGARANVLTGRASAEQRMGKDTRKTVDAAIAEYDEAIRQAPDDALYYLNRGMAWTSRAEAETAAGGDGPEMYDKSIADYGQAIAHRPGFAPAYNSRGIAWMTKGNALKARGDDPKECWEKALADFGKAADLDASHWMSRANRGVLFEQLGREEEAVAEYEKALAICPGQPDVTKLHDAAKKKIGKSGE